jgi:hypothetical protein
MPYWRTSRRPRETRFMIRPESRSPPFDNAFTSEPASFLACYLLPPGETRLIEMLPRLR